MTKTQIGLAIGGALYLSAIPIVGFEPAIGSFLVFGLCLIPVPILVFVIHLIKYRSAPDVLGKGLLLSGKIWLALTIVVGGFMMVFGHFLKWQVH